ncbi:hypothetical protein DBR40_07910 [Pedobacter sp. KBW01]|nr:hypothetical protein DBR40_07910 [Pedobacter sp. KBW01]
MITSQNEIHVAVFYEVLFKKYDRAPYNLAYYVSENQDAIKFSRPDIFGINLLSKIIINIHHLILSC